MTMNPTSALSFALTAAVTEIPASKVGRVPSPAHVIEPDKTGNDSSMSMTCKVVEVDSLKWVLSSS